MQDLFEHADYQAVDERARWKYTDGDLADLWRVLKSEAWLAKGERVLRVLPSGLLIAVWVIADGNLAMRRVLQLRRPMARCSPPKSGHGKSPRSTKRSAPRSGAGP
jgi:hypothetical protein